MVGMGVDTVSINNAECYCECCGNPLNFTDIDNICESHPSLARQLEDYLKDFEDNIQRVSIKYNSEGTPIEATIYISILTGNGTKGSFSYYPPDEFITEIWEKKQYLISYRGKMHYYPIDCTTCSHKKCQDCDKVEIGAKWIFAEKTIKLTNEHSFEKIATKLLANI